MDVEAMADQARGNVVEDAPQDEAATRCDEHARLIVVGGSPLRQQLECGALDLDALAGIAAPDHFVDEAPIGGEVREVARAAQLDAPGTLSLSTSPPRLPKPSLLSAISVARLASQPL
jgi:hypothetical protein